MSTCSRPLYAETNFADAARKLADKAVAVLGPLEHIEFAFRNLASLDMEQAAEAGKTVENELRSRGFQLAGESEATAKVRVTLSENLQNYIWVAEMSRGQVHEQAMVVQIRPQKAGAAAEPLRLAIQAKLIFEQEDPMLDLAFLDEDLIVLDTRHLSLYRKRNDRWELERAAAIAHTYPWPRDARGRLSVADASVSARLPGLSCNGTVKPKLVLKCAGDESPWPLESGPARFESTKNFFIRDGLPPFFSAAATGEGNGASWIFSGSDGRTRLYDKALQPVGTIAGWGSDIAAVNGRCGVGNQILVSLPVDPSGRGMVQAFEISRRQPIAVATPAEFPGPIAALWPVSRGDAAFAVVRDIMTGRYAAYYLSINCSQ